METKLIKDIDCPLPAYIAAADRAMEHLKSDFDYDHPVGMCFFGARFAHNNMPYEYHRVAAWGDEEQLIIAIRECFNMQPKAYRTFTRAWFNHFLDHTKDDPDPKTRDARRAILRYLNRTESGEQRTNEDEGRYLIDQIAREHPERTDRINILLAKAKVHRRSGLNDLRLMLENEAARLSEEVTNEEQLLSQRQANAREALRVRQQRQQEAQELQRLEHDYDSMGRRIKNYRAMIARLTAEMEQLQQEQNQMEQRNPQFDVHSAAKRKRQQLAERKRERAALKKKGKETDETAHISLAESMRRKIG